jgi:DNA (cytosine-5)-methyltransferase 1
VAHANAERRDGRSSKDTANGQTRRFWSRRFEVSDWWTTEPDVGRVAHGVPSRVDRLRGLGNAVVPQVAEWIGRRLMEMDA